MLDKARLRKIFSEYFVPMPDKFVNKSGILHFFGPTGKPLTSLKTIAFAKAADLWKSDSGLSILP